MLKLLGALLLTGGGLALGLGAVSELAGRLRGLNSLAAALRIMEGELAFRLPSTPDLLDTAAHRAPMPAADFFAACAAGMERLGEQSFGDIWADALGEHPMGLAREDRDVVLELGAILGRCGGEDQRKAAAAARARLEERAGELRTALRCQGKAYGTLGLSLGAFFTILLL